MMGDNKTYFAQNGAELTRCLHERARRFKSEQPLERLTIIAPSAFAAQVFNRDLVKSAGSGLFNVYFLRLEDVARQLTFNAPQFAGRKPLNNTAVALALHKALKQSGLAAAEHFARPAYTRALVGMFNELGAVGDDALAAARGVGAAQAQTLELMRAARATLGKSHFSYRELAEYAAQTLNATNDLGKVILIVAGLPDGVNRDLWIKLAEAPGAERIIIPTGHKAVDERVCELLAVAPPADFKPDLAHTDIKFISVRNLTDEKTAVMRSLMAHIDAGASPRKLAVLCPDEAYYDAFARTLTMEGVPVSAAVEKRDALLSLIEFARLLVAMADKKSVDKRVFTNWLKAAPIKMPDGDGAPSIALWSRLSETLPRDKPERWANQIVQYGESLARQIEREPDSAPDKRLLADAAPRYARFIERFLEDIQLADALDWDEWVDWFIKMTRRYNAAHQAPELNDILDQIPASKVGRTNALKGVKLSLEQLWQILSDRLQSYAHRAPSQNGVKLARAHEIVGATFDAIYIVGMTTGAFPTPQTHEGMLPDRLKRQIAPDDPSALPSAQSKLDNQKALFGLALKCAKTVVMHWPRFDGERETFPSEWFVEALKLKTGRPVAVGDLIKSNAPLVEDYKQTVAGLVESRGDMTTGDIVPVNAAEYDLMVASGYTSINRDYIGESPQVQNARAVVNARNARRAWSVYEGNLTSVANLLKQNEMQASFRRWNTFLRCPYEYFLNFILEVPIERSEDLTQIDARERGVIIHSILQRLFEYRQHNQQTDLSSANQAQILSKLMDEQFKRDERKIYYGHRAVWEYEKTHIRRQLEHWLQAEKKHWDDGWRQTDSEVRFGFAGDGIPAAIVTANSVKARFRGVIDRVDSRELTTDETEIMILDYKTGNPKFQGEFDLQLAIYAAALAQSEELKADRINASLWFVMSDNPQISFEFDSRVAQSRLTQISELIIECIQNGMFPTFNHRYCACQNEISKQKIERIFADNPRLKEAYLTQR